MDPARFNESVVIKSLTKARDTDGNPTESYATLYTMMATIVFKGGREALVGGGLMEDRTVEFTIWYRANIDNTCIIVWDSKDFNIEYVERIGKKEGLRLICKNNA